MDGNSSGAGMDVRTGRGGRGVFEKLSALLWVSQGDCRAVRGYLSNRAAAAGQDHPKGAPERRVRRRSLCGAGETAGLKREAGL